VLELEDPARERSDQSLVVPAVVKTSADDLLPDFDKSHPSIDLAGTCLSAAANENDCDQHELLDLGTLSNRTLSMQRH
jgi:hypothetical protein